MSKSSETQGFAGGKNEAVMSSSMVFPEALAIVWPLSGEDQACDVLVTCALVQGCPASWGGPV